MRLQFTAKTKETRECTLPDKYLDATVIDIDWEVDDEDGDVNLPSEVKISDQFVATDYQHEGNIDMTSLTEDVINWLCDHFGFLVRNLSIKVSSPCISVHVSDS